MFVHARLVLLIIRMSCFRVVFKYKGSAAKIFIGYVRLLFVKFSSIPGVCGFQGVILSQNIQNSMVYNFQILKKLRYPKQANKLTELF